MNKCDNNFKTQNAYIEGKEVGIDEFDNQSIPYCQNNHELTYVKGTKVKSYFRHKNSGDTYSSNVGEWHLDWQSRFPSTEIEFKQLKGQICKRRADVFLKDYNTIVELQHSFINKQSVEERKKDYELHNINIVWVIDGNYDINVSQLTHSNRVYLQFTKDTWRFESFLSYDTVYYDIKGEIYKIRPSSVKSYMIDVQKPVNKDYFISCIQENNFNLWEEDSITQSNLYVKQLGAGNGKTYDAVRLFQQPEFKHYKYFIYLTKQHSAKTVIKQELYKLNSECEEVIDKEIDNEKKYIYILKNGVKVIIATLDSFVYSIADKTKVVENTNMFEAYANRIIDGETTINANGKINYAIVNPYMNKETMIILDETQDLAEYYAIALIKVMRDRYIDLYVIGDQLQSLSLENNAFVYFNEKEISNINKERIEPKNVCRRFKNAGIRDLVNGVIDFSRYGLPPISLYEEHTKGGYEIISDEVDDIMKKFDNEVKTHNRLPEDFLLVTPFVKNNYIMEQLYTAINEYWLNKFGDYNYRSNVLDKNEYWSKNKDIDIYRNYAVFHRSEEGTSIDLDQSEHATRMVSIHSSKGDGRNVVFVIGLSERGLNRFGKTNSIVYDSLIHVALTRVKENMYVCLDTRNYDDIYVKFISKSETNRIELEEMPCIPNYITFNIKPEVDDNLKTVLKNFQLEDTTNNKKIIDMKHHNIRYHCIYINIFKNLTFADKKKQNCAILHHIKNADIKTFKKMKEFYKENKHDRTQEKISLLKYGDNHKDYDKYFYIIKEYTDFLQKKVSNILMGKQVDLCVIESIILSYMIKSFERGNKSDFGIIDLYDIIDKYYKSYNTNTKHDTCLCPKLFTHDRIINDDTLNVYICEHYNKMKIIDKQFKYICDRFPELEWLNFQPVCYKGQSTDFKVKKTYEFIAYNSECVIIPYIKPTFSNINFNETIIDAYLDTLFVSNCDKEEFINKKVIITVLSTELIEPFIIEHSHINKNDVKPYIKNLILNFYETRIKAIHVFYKYTKEKNDKDLKNFLKSGGILDSKIKEKKMPSFLNVFFNNIINEYSKTNHKDKRKFIETYMNEYKFTNELKNELENSIEGFLEEAEEV